jgi:predicted phosphoribosyltransferase
MAFKDRLDAGRQLAKMLMPYAREDCIILALPRGGVVLGVEVAKTLGKPLDVLVVRKIGAPMQPELAVGAIGPDGSTVLNRELIDHLGIKGQELADRIAREATELNRRLRLFRGERLFPELGGRTVIIVDDGLATGSTAEAAIQTVKAMDASKIVLAVPVGPRSTISVLRHDVDELVCMEAPEVFDAVSRWYVDFPQVSDAEVVNLLEEAWGEPVSSGDWSERIRYW